jgi:hypothetical protein
MVYIPYNASINNCRDNVQWLTLRAARTAIRWLRPWSRYAAYRTGSPPE